MSNNILVDPDNINKEDLDQTSVNDDLDQDEDKLVPEKFRGKTKADIIEMYLNLEKVDGRKSNEIGELRHLTDQLLQVNINDKSTEQPEPVKVTSEQLLDSPNEVLNEVVEQSSLAKKVQSLEEARVNDLIEARHKDFIGRYPGYMETVSDAEFQSWVVSSPYRTQLFQKADARDYDAAEELLGAYNEYVDAVGKEKQERAEEERQEKLKAAQLERSSTGEKSKKIFRRTELAKMKITDPDSYYDPGFQQELMQAYADKRVR